ncbi:MAG: 16S rRNA (guanine(527)-N(7))-methyltransferase RsmG [Micrococcales bacterium]|nr:16S rRNA (guanine(527)-N(7))-methyltransferase RsmG [Micrococcales bacterium]
MVADGRPTPVGSEASSDDRDPLEDDDRLPAYFLDAWPAIREFSHLLRRYGAERGLIGPRESGRLWERHLLNSAGVVTLLPAAGEILDLGSGGGLPGLVIAAMRARARVRLVEPMERRVAWLRFVVAELDLDNVEVCRARAEEIAGKVEADAITARAVSSLENLYRWAAPLTRRGGGLYAIKGVRAGDEVTAARTAERRYGWTDGHVEAIETLPGVTPTRVVCATRTGG